MRTMPSASTGWSLVAGKTPKAFAPGMSFAMRMRARPGWRASTGARSPIVNRADAWGERTKRSHSASGGWWSAPNRSVPSTFGRPSTRAMRAPTASPARATTGAKALAPRATSITASTIFA